MCELDRILFLMSMNLKYLSGYGLIQVAIIYVMTPYIGGVAMNFETKSKGQ